MAVLQGIPVDEINARAREIRLGRTLLTMLAAVLYGLGWVTAKTVRVIWMAIAWSAVAVKVGWREGWKPAHVKA